MQCARVLPKRSRTCREDVGQLSFESTCKVCRGRTQRCARQLQPHGAGPNAAPARPANLGNAPPTAARHHPTRCTHTQCRCMCMHLHTPVHRSSRRTCSLAASARRLQAAAAAHRSLSGSSLSTPDCSRASGRSARLGAAWMAPSDTSFPVMSTVEDIVVGKLHASWQLAQRGFGQPTGSSVPSSPGVM